MFAGPTTIKERKYSRHDGGLGAGKVKSGTNNPLLLAREKSVVAPNRVKVVARQVNGG